MGTLGTPTDAWLSINSYAFIVMEDKEKEIKKLPVYAFDEKDYIVEVKKEVGDFKTQFGRSTNK